MGRRSDINWVDIQRDYRLGLTSIKRLATTHRIADSTLRARAKAENWPRDCGDLIRRAREQALSNMVQTQAETIGAEIGAQQARQVHAAVAEAVMEGVEVVLEHKRDARRGMRIVQTLLRDAEALVSAAPALLKDLDALRKADPMKAALLERALNLKGLADVLDRLGSAAAKFHAIERQAHGLDKEVPDKGNEIDELLKRVHAERLRKLSAEPS